MSQPCLMAGDLKNTVFGIEEHFLFCFYIPQELPSPTTRVVVSHNSGAFLFKFKKKIF